MSSGASRASGAIWKIGQLACIAGLTWVTAGMEEPNPKPPAGTPAMWAVAFVMAVIFTAFFTAVIVNAWDWLARLLRGSHAKLQGLPFRAGRAVARLRTTRRQRRQAIEQSDRGRARLGRCELREPPPALR